MTYLVVLLMFLILLIFTQKFKSKIIKLIPFIFIGIVSGIRYDVGVDYHNYVEIYDLIINGVYQYTEIGYNSLVLFIHLLNGNQQLVFFITALLTNVFIGLFILYFSNAVILSSILYYTFSFFYLLSFNAVRQYLAISIFGLSLIYLSKDKRLKSILILLLASLFHKSVIFLIPILFILKRDINFKKYILLYIIFIVSLFFVDDLIVYTGYDYLLTYKNQDINSFVYLFIIVNFLILINKNKIKKKFPKNGFIFINLAYFSTMTISGIFFTDRISNTVFFRMNYYFLITYLILVGYIKKIIKNKYAKILYFLLVFYFLIFYFTKTVFLNGEIYNIIPYEINIHFFGN